MNKTGNANSLGKIPFYHWLLVLVVLGAIGVGVWQSILPFLAERRFRDGYNFFMAERYKYAIEELQLAKKYAPWETHYQIQLGRAMEEYAAKLPTAQEKMAVYNELIVLYTDMIRMDELNPWYHSRLGATYADLSIADPANSEKYIQLAIKHNKDATIVDPNNPLFHLNYAYFLHRLYSPEYTAEAKKYYNRVLEIDDSLGEARYNLADIYRREGNIQESLNQYLEIEKKNPEFNNLYVAIATTYLAMGKENEALPYFEKALANTTTRPEVLRNIAAIYYKNSQWEKARYYYYQLFAESPESRPELHQYYIQAIVGIGNFRAAESELLSYLKDYPNDPHAPNQLRLLRNYMSANKIP